MTSTLHTHLTSLFSHKPSGVDFSAKLLLWWGGRSIVESTLRRNCWKPFTNWSNSSDSAHHYILHYCIWDHTLFIRQGERNSFSQARMNAGRLLKSGKLQIHMANHSAWAVLIDNHRMDPGSLVGIQKSWSPDWFDDARFKDERYKLSQHIFQMGGWLI